MNLRKSNQEKSYIRKIQFLIKIQTPPFLSPHPIQGEQVKTKVIDLRLFIFIQTNVAMYELLLQYNVHTFFQLAIPLENYR